jgi:hypothetical protein
VGSAQALPSSTRAAARSCGSKPGPLDALKIGTHELSPFAANSADESAQGSPQAPHDLDRIRAVLANFIERKRQVIAPAWYLEDHPQGTILTEGARGLKIALCIFDLSPATNDLTTAVQDHRAWLRRFCSYAEIGEAPIERRPP